jgi:hypothetical protein
MKLAPATVVANNRTTDWETPPSRGNCPCDREVPPLARARPRQKPSLAFHAVNDQSAPAPRATSTLGPIGG